MLRTILKKYDSYLNYQKQLDGSITIFRQSPFNSQRQFKVFTIKNQYVGSCNWVIQKIALMDSQHFDIGGRILANNRRITDAKNDDRMTREIVELFENGGEKIII